MRWMRLLFVALLLPILAAAQPFTVQDIAFLGAKREVITDWAQRVVSNGGAMPSQNTILAMETLRMSLETQGLTNKIYSLCIFVPDSVIAASTPLVKWKGSDPWTNNGFVSGDLNVNGLKPHSLTNFLDTAIIAETGATTNHLVGTNLGLSCIVTESTTNATIPVIQNSAFVPGNHGFALLPSGGGASQVYLGAVQSGMDIVTNDFLRVGYYSGNRHTTNNALYVASPVESHKMLSSNSPTAGSLNVSSSTLAFYQSRIQGTNVANSVGQFRLSMACIHDGFTQVESSNFWWAVYTCRVALGGGTGDPIHDYNTRLGNNAVSVNTSNAFRTFRQGLDTDNLLYKMISVNCYATDNLTAARSPLVVQSGNLVWTNTSFVDGDLSINGLTGNGTTKFLGTGIKPSIETYAGFSDTFAGLSTIIYSTVNDSNQFVMGSAGTTANGTFAVGNQVGLAVFYCWIFTTINTDFLVRTLPNAGWEGYLSGNRTANNAIALYWVTNQVHNVATNATGATASNNNTMTNMFAHAIASGLNVAANLSSQTISFNAIHGGLTQTESSNLWIRARDARNQLGGGVPP